MPRFDDRVHRQADDGTDFQTFVWEALGTHCFDRLLHQRYVRPHFVRGNDGAIDHVAQGEDDCIIIECKFFGAMRQGKPSADWRAVAKTLGVNLFEIAARTSSTAPNIYSPWFRNTHPVAGYWFCTSAEFNHEGDQATLRDEIKGFFDGLAKLHPSLDHLNKVDVQVLGWNDFKGALASRPPLHFRWFGGVPIGLSPLEYDASPERFREFLSQAHLPFFSREDFGREMGRKPNVAITPESHLLSHLLNPSGTQMGLVLSGGGGTGKTRLALELGRKAIESGWLVFRVQQTVKAEAVETLSRHYTKKAQVLLVIDYAEGVRQLTDIVAAMLNVNTSGHCFRFVATCRSGALPSVTESLSDVQAEILEFSDQPTATYNNWVVRNILQFGKIPKAEAVRIICGSMPVLAAFAVFLYRHYPETFDIQFGDIHREEKFAAWFEKRLRLSLKDKHIEIEVVGRLVAAIALSLPIDETSYYALRDKSPLHARVLDVLEGDRWLERYKGILSSVHDIFADALVGRYIFAAGVADSSARTGDVLSDAMAAGSLDRALNSLVRLAAHPRFDKIDGLQLFERLENANAEAVTAARATILSGQLLSDREKIILLRDFKRLTAAVQNDIACDEAISRLAVGATKIKDSGLQGSAIKVLQPLLDVGVARSPHPVLGRALRLIPDRYRSHALACVKVAPTPTNPPHLLVSWLLAGLPLEEVADEVEVWLDSGGNRAQSGSMVLPAWLERKGSLEFVETHLLIWLSLYAKLESASFVYAAWLNAKGDAGRVEAEVLAWLAEHGAKIRAQFVISAWLSKANTPGKIETQVLSWLVLHGARLDASFVLSPCLEANVILERIEPLTLSWLALHDTDSAASFVLRSWLQAGRCPKKIETHLLAWLDLHGTEVNAWHIYEAWLTAKGGTGTIEKDLLRWLGGDQPVQIGQIVLSWLQAKGSPEKISKYVISWLDAHGTELRAEYVYNAWLRGRGDPEVVENNLRKWMVLHGISYEAGYVYRRWLNAGGARTMVEERLIAWLTKFCEKEHGGVVCWSWLDAGGSFKQIEPFVLAWIAQHRLHKEAGEVYRALLDAKQPLVLVETNAVAWFSMYHSHKEAGSLYKSWLAVNGPVSAIEIFLLGWLKTHDATDDSGDIAKLYRQATERAAPSGEAPEQVVDPK
jgi:hypothetical protein